MVAQDRRWRIVNAIIARQHGHITRAQALKAGLTPAEIRRELDSGRWSRRHPGVYRIAGARSTPEAKLMAGCLTTGGWVSHEWAAWLWDMTDLPTTPPSISVRRSARCERTGIALHRCAEPRFARPPTYRNLPCTDRLTTLVDFASVATAEQLDHAVDVALARRGITVGSLLAELERLRARRQHGVGALRASLRRRGYIGAPQPSRLESLVLRLLASAGVRPLRAEEPVWISDRHYRLDFVLAEGLALEVDGYVWHPPSRQDHRRRNQIGNRGWRVLVFTWKDITEDPSGVLAEVREALAVVGASARG